MNTNKISKHQLFFMIIQSQVGIGILGLPYQVFQRSETDGWISILIAGAIIQVIMFIYIYLFKLNKNELFYNIIAKYFGKWIGKCVVFLYFIYFFAISSLISMLFVEIIDIWILPVTPNWIVGIMFVYLALMLGSDSIRTIARFNVLISPLLILIIVMPALALKDAHILYLLPIGQSGIKNIIVGSKDALLAMLGFEILLFILPISMGSMNKKAFVLMLSNITLTCSYCILVLITYMYFSPDEIKIVPQPLLYVLRSFSFKIIERVDLIFLTIWVMVVYTSLVNYFYLMMNTGKYLIPKKKYHRSLSIFLGFSLVLVDYLIDDNSFKLAKVAEHITNTSFIFFFVIPTLLFILSLLVFLFNKGKSNEKNL